MVVGVKKARFYLVIWMLFAVGFLFISPVKAVESSSAATNTKTLPGSGSVKSNISCTKVGNPTDEMPAVCKSSGGRAVPFPDGFVYYCQADPQYNDTCAYGWAICGPTSMAMIMSTLGYPINPKETDLVFNQLGARICGDEPSQMPVFLGSQWFAEKGFKAVPLEMPLDLNLAQDFLSQGYLILGSVTPHIFPIDAVNPAEGTVHLRDPDKTCDPAGYWAPAKQPWIFRGVPQAMIYAYAIKKVN